MDFNARWYDPAIGRFTSVDPLAESAPGWTTYRFGFNNPILFNDPSGLLEDTYGVDNDGNISKIDDKKHYTFNIGYSGGFPMVTATEVDKLVKTDSGSYSSDENGNPTGNSIDVKKGNYHRVKNSPDCQWVVTTKQVKVYLSF